MAFVHHLFRIIFSLGKLPEHNLGSRDAFFANPSTLAGKHGKTDVHTVGIMRIPSRDVGRAAA